MFFLCFSLICPCCYGKKKDTSEDPVLQRDMNKFNSDSVNGSNRSVGSKSVNGPKSVGSQSVNGPKSVGSKSVNGPKSVGSKSVNGPKSVGSASVNGSKSVGSKSVNGSTSSRVIGMSQRVPGSPARLSLSSQSSKSETLNLSLNQITKLTRNFSSSLKIGEGSFGTVYRADLADGHSLAIKRAKKQSFSNSKLEYKNEVSLLAKIEHKNLVQLLGYIDQGNERIIISEYVPNGTLREHLDGERGKILDFGQRLEIAIDVSHGLTYLHLYAERPIIHRDVKSSNILITESLHAKVADFGFARTGSTDPDQSQIETDIRGTVGYLDPEYLKSNQLTIKSDVFSFGILLVEILTGRRPVEVKRSFDERITIRWAFDKFNKGQVRQIIDPMLMEEINDEVVNKFFNLAFQCAAPTRADRPVMKEVVEQLWKIRKDYGRSRRKV